MNTLLTLHAVSALFARQRTAIYADIQQGVFPRPIKIGRSSRWPSHEVDEIIASRIAGKNDEEIRQLVAELEAKRRK